MDQSSKLQADGSSDVPERAAETYRLIANPQSSRRHDGTRGRLEWLVLRQVVISLGRRCRTLRAPAHLCIGAGQRPYRVDRALPPEIRFSRPEWHECGTTSPGLSEASLMRCAGAQSRSPTGRGWETNSRRPMNNRGLGNLLMDERHSSATGARPHCSRCRFSPRSVVATAETLTYGTPDPSDRCSP